MKEARPVQSQNATDEHEMTCRLVWSAVGNLLGCYFWVLPMSMSEAVRDLAALLALPHRRHTRDRPLL